MRIHISDFNLLGIVVCCVVGLARFNIRDKGSAPLVIAGTLYVMKHFNLD